MGFFFFFFLRADVEGGARSHRQKRRSARECRWRRPAASEALLLPTPEPRPDRLRTCWTLAHPSAAHACARDRTRRPAEIGFHGKSSGACLE